MADLRQPGDPVFVLPLTNVGDSIFDAHSAPVAIATGSGGLADGDLRVRRAAALVALCNFHEGDDVPADLLVGSVPPDICVNVFDENDTYLSWNVPLREVLGDDDAEYGDIRATIEGGSIAGVGGGASPRYNIEKAELRDLSRGAVDVLQERLRQIKVEGWDAAHDDREHGNGDLAIAGACYAAPYAVMPATNEQVPVALTWPWQAEWWKPKDVRSNLVRAAALIIAEIDRLDRQANAQALSANAADRTAPADLPPQPGPGQ